MLASILLFGYFNGHHDKWLNPFNITDVAAIHIFNFSIAHYPRQIMDFPSRFPNKYEQHTSLLDLSKVANIFVRLNFPKYKNSFQQKSL